MQEIILVMAVARNEKFFNGGKDLMMANTASRWRWKHPMRPTMAPQPSRGRVVSSEISGG